MKYHLTDIYNIEELKQLCQSFTDITEVVTAILDMEGNVLVATGWKDICTKFHRVNPVSSKLCTESDTALAGQLESGCKYNVYKCKNGLMDVAMPIIVGDNHIGNLFTGQFLTEAPDIEYFRNQARKYNFDENEYLKALADVPVFSEEQIKSHVSFLVQLTEIVGNIGLKNLIAIEQSNQKEIEKQNLKKINEEYQRLNKEYQEINEELTTAKEKMQESEETYRMLYECINDALFTSELLDDGTLGKFVMVNDVACERLGYSRQELLSMTPADINSDESRAFLSQRIHTILDSKHAVLETEHVTKDGRKIPTEINTYVAKLKDKTIFHTIARDITARKRAENEVRKLNSELEQRVQQRTEELNVKNADLEKAIFKLQETQSQLILFEKMTVLRHLISGIAHEINNPLGAIDSSREQLEKGTRLLVSHVNDISRWLNESDGHLLSELIDLAGADVNNTMGLSFSERRKVRSNIINQLNEKNIADADQIGAVLAEFNISDNIEHFMPLLRHENILDKLGVIRSIMDSYIACNTIKTAVGKSAKIVNALRSYTRKEGGSPNKVVSDIRDGIETVLQLFQNTFKFFAELEFDCEDDIPQIPCFPDQLNQVWTNLIQNALHAMDNKGKLRVEVKSHNSGVLVKVIDNGCGMTPEVQARIFEPLFTTKPAGEGIGLGMDIVHMIIVERHNGTIDIDSEPGKGTTISVFLPLQSSPQKNNIISDQTLCAN